MIKSLAFLIIFSLFLQITLNYEHDHLTTEEIAAEVDQKIITYGTTVRIQNQKTKYHLHSHDVRYGSGSGQQSVTGMENKYDYNSLWMIKEGHGHQQKFHLDPVKCGDVVRFEHNLSKKNLHTHEIPSPLSGKLEVSAYGNDGNGDTGDNWVIECDSQKVGEVLKASMIFHIRHQELKAFVFATTNHQFNQQNCGDCPILGQLEISCDYKKSQFTMWKITSGVFYTKAYKDGKLQEIGEIIENSNAKINQKSDEDDDASQYQDL